jgi:23S rRNA pseudouridine1911/1915/1917 synthase
MADVTVLYEDNHLIAVFKPAGVLAQADKTGDASIMDEVKTYLKEKYKKPGNVFLGLLHRLDRPVCGLILFAKTSKGASRLSEQFRNHQVQKAYQAIVAGKPAQQSGVLVNRLIKDEKLHKAREKADGAVARLFYEVLKSNGKYSLLKIRIEGGKFHQIRSQLSLAGLPILGDVKYKGEQWGDAHGIALCATELSFTPATSNENVKVVVEIPKEWEEYLK